jgi:hypothetical protein
MSNHIGRCAFLAATASTVATLAATCCARRRRWSISVPRHHDTDERFARFHQATGIKINPRRAQPDALLEQ